MAKILALAESGFGKTSSYIRNPKLGIEGLDPKESYIITVTSKDLPGRGEVDYPVAQFGPKENGWGIEHLKTGRRIVTNNAKIIAYAIELLGTTPIEAVRNIVLDDSNYIMQDHYMKKALSTGWETPKQIGYNMGLIFEAMEGLPRNKNFIMYAHGEEYDKADGRKGYRMKTTGKMVQEYLTPEGKFGIVLIGKSSYDEAEKKAKKQFVVEDDGVFSSAKSGGIFEDLYIPNDMGYVLKKIEEYRAS